MAADAVAISSGTTGRVAPTVGRLCSATQTSSTRPIVGAPQAPEAKSTNLARLRRTDIRPYILCQVAKPLRPKVGATRALLVAWYNFARKHETLKGKTPAMASGLSDHVWTIKELIERAAQ